MYASSVLGTRVCLWLVRAWVRIPFEAIFADIGYPKADLIL